jgi:hypothetical protein
MEINKVDLVIIVQKIKEEERLKKTEEADAAKTQ